MNLTTFRSFIILITVCLSSRTAAYAQANDEDLTLVDDVMQEYNIEGNDTIYYIVDQDAQFPGGQDEMFAYITKNLKFPDVLIEEDLEGRVFVNFQVNKDGSLSQIKVLKSLEPSVDQYVVEFTSNMPTWEPAMKKGIPVCTKYTLPYSFDLEGDDDEEPEEEEELSVRAFWTGTDLGTAFTMDETVKFLPQQSSWSIDPLRSVDFAINMFAKRIKLVGDYLGLVSGVGYRVTGLAIQDNQLLSYMNDSLLLTKGNQVYSRNTLYTNSVQVPLLFQVTPMGVQKDFAVSFGIIGGARFVSNYRLRGKTDQGDVYNNVIRSKFYLNPFYADAVVRINFSTYGVYAGYRLTDVFQAKNTNGIRLFTVGLALSVD